MTIDFKNGDTSGNELKKLLEGKVAEHNNLVRETFMIRGEIRLLQTLISKITTDKSPEKEPVV